MIIAAAYENGMVCQDFARAAQVKLYTVEHDRVVKMEVVDTDGGDVTAFLKRCGVGILVCGRLDGATQAALMSSGIAVFPGAYGDADLQVGALLARMLTPVEQPETACDSDACAKCAHRDSCTDRR